MLNHPKGLFTFIICYMEYTAGGTIQGCRNKGPLRPASRFYRMTGVYWPAATISPGSHSAYSYKKPTVLNSVRHRQPERYFPFGTPLHSHRTRLYGLWQIQNIWHFMVKKAAKARKTGEFFSCNFCPFFCTKNIFCSILQLFYYTKGRYFVV